MMHTAPAAPSAPPRIDVIIPLLLNPPSCPCDWSVATGTRTAIRKYATPTPSSAFSGLPEATWPLCSAGP